MMPVAEHRAALFYGMIMVGVYLFGVCYHFQRVNDRRQNLETADSYSPDLLLLCVALYGTCSLLHFMGRSHPANLHVGFMAFLLLCIVGLHTISHAALRMWGERAPALRIRQLAWGALCVYGLFVWMRESQVRVYPNVIRMLIKPIQPREIALYTDQWGRKQDPHKGLLAQFVEHSDSAPTELYPGSGVCLPQSFQPQLQQYTPVVEEARALERAG